MKIIAHRGNTKGSDPAKENTTSHITEALLSGFDVEIDVWYVGGNIFLGHDKPEHEIPYSFLIQHGLWIHCKTVETLVHLYSNPSLNVFFHERDVAITSWGYLFTAPGLPIGYRSIAVMPELVENWDIGHAFGVCTDYPNKWT